MKILMIDNFDSFTYNLVQYLGELGAQVEVARNNAVTIADIEKINPDGIVISPGPGVPEDAGISCRIIEELSTAFPIFGVCLGHQTIGQVFGGRIVHAPILMHGKTSKIFHEGKSIFAGLPEPFVATRYHSLIIDADSVPECLEVIANTHDNIIMGIRHRELPVIGVQFHPESIISEYGKELIDNFLKNYVEKKKS